MHPPPPTRLVLGGPIPHPPSQPHARTTTQDALEGPCRTTPSPFSGLEGRRCYPLGLLLKWVGIRLIKSWTLVRLRGSGGKRVRAHLYTAVYRYIRPLPPRPPQRIAARRKDLGLHPMWDPPRSDPPGQGNKGAGQGSF